MYSTKLGDIFVIQSGGTPSKSRSDFYEDGDIPWIKTGDLKEKYILNDVDYITELGLHNSSAKLFPINTVLVAMYGATIGACSILPFEASTNQACAAFLPNEKVLPEYLYYFLCANKESFIKDGVGGAQPNISAGYLKKVAFELKSISEQRKIVDIFDKAKSIIDNRKQQLQQLDELVKARFGEMISSTNKTVRLDTLIKSYRAEKCGKNTYPVLSITMHNGLILQSERFKKEIASSDKSQYKVVPRNKLVVAFPIDEGLLSAQTVVDVGIVSPAYSLYDIEENMVYPKVLEYILRSESSIQYYKSKLRGTTLRRRMIPKSDFDSMPICLPNLEMQKRFLAEVDQIDKSKVAVQKALDEAQTLFDSLMQEYFG